MGKVLEIKGSGSDKYLIDLQGNVTHKGYFPTMSSDVPGTKGGSQIVDYHFNRNLGCIGREGRLALEKNPSQYALGFFAKTPGFLDNFTIKVNGLASLSGTPEEIKKIWEKQNK